MEKVIMTGGEKSCPFAAVGYYHLLIAGSNSEQAD
jgi:hypothetical protein